MRTMGKANLSLQHHGRNANENCENSTIAVMADDGQEWLNRAILDSRTRLVSRHIDPHEGSSHRAYHGAFGPALRYHSRICSPVQNSTSRFFRIFSKMQRKY